MSIELSKINCIVCDQLIEIIGTEPSIPATIFDTNGNYGSTIIDNIKSDEPKMVIIICDECLNRKKEFLYSQFRKNYDWLPYYKKYNQKNPRN